MAKIKAGQLARCGGVLVEVIEVSRDWAKVKPFHKSDGVEPFDRLVSQLTAVR